MFRAAICPSSGADNYVVLSPRVGIVPWLQEGCQNRLAGSVSTEEFVAQLRTPQWTHYLLTSSDSLPAATARYQHVAITPRSRQLLKMGTWLPETCWATCKGEIKDNTKVTSSWFLIHTEAKTFGRNNYNNRKIILYCILTIALILINVTTILIVCGISHIFVDTQLHMRNK